MTQSETAVCDVCHRHFEPFDVVPFDLLRPVIRTIVQSYRPNWHSGNLTIKMDQLLSHQWQRLLEIQQTMMEMVADTANAKVPLKDRALHQKPAYSAAPSESTQNPPKNPSKT